MQSKSFDDAIIDPLDQEQDDLFLPPQPTADQLNKMLYGIIGDVARTASKDNEVNPISVALACITWLSAEISPKYTYDLGDQAHGANVWGVHIGRSSRGGKGESFALIKRIRQKIEEKCYSLGLNILSIRAGSLSTGEGLANQLHDGYAEGAGDKRMEVEPILDKRLFVVEPEFTSVLSKASRSGNTLSQVMRDIWDYYPRIGSMLKTSTRISTGAHISILGNATPFELRKVLSDSDIFSGLANRFLFIYAERTRIQPLPVTTPQHEVDRLADTIMGLIVHAKDNYGNEFFTSSHRKSIPLSPEALNHWNEAYKPLRSPFGNNPVVQSLCERGAPYTFRIALLMAILDRSNQIEKQHLECGIAWVEFSRLSTAFIFGDAQAKIETDPDDIKLLDFLKMMPNHEATRKQITKDCYKGHRSKAIIDGVITRLLDSHDITAREEKTQGAVKNTAFYQLNTANFENFANIKYNQQLNERTLMRTLPPFNANFQDSTSDRPKFANDNSKFAEKFAIQPVDIKESSLSSLSSHSSDNESQENDDLNGRNPSREEETF